MTNITATTSFKSYELEVKSEAITSLAAQFTISARKTAEGVLEMGHIVLQASKLKESEFVRFCELVNINESKSTISKLKAIGEKYEFFKARADNLPASWTTIYEITKLPNEVIDDLIDQGVLSTSMAASKLSLALGKSKTKSPEKTLVEIRNGSDEGLGFRAKLKKNPDQATAARIKELIAELKSLNVAVELGSTLEAFFTK